MVNRRMSTSGGIDTKMGVWLGVTDLELIVEEWRVGEGVYGLFISYLLETSVMDSQSEGELEYGVISSAFEEVV